MMTIPPTEYRELLKLGDERREEVRREIERHVEPFIQSAHQTDKAAISLGQSSLRTTTLLNGGALVAIPAVVALFGIDAKAITFNLLIAGGVFVLCLVFCWLSSAAGFFALSHRADRDYATGESNRQNIFLFHYKDETRKAETLSQIMVSNQNVIRHNKSL
jgi:hypothetical protein